MVDGLNNNVPKPATKHSTLKIKGTDQKIDLNNLVGLQKTKGNEALFKTYDKNNNGVIDQDEAYMMRNNLQSLAGNGTISKREINKQFGKDSNALDQLTNLANQQATADGTEYVETTGNTTTRIYNSNVDDKYSYRSEQTTNSDGSVSTTTTFSNGEIEKELKDKNGRIVTDSDGNQTVYNVKGVKTMVIQSDGTTIQYSPDGNKTTTMNSQGQITSTMELIKNQTEVRTDFEYKDGATIARKYETTDGNFPQTPSEITVSTTKDGHSIDTKYTSEEDMTNGRPSEQITDAHNPTLKTVTKFTYDEAGNVKAEITNSAGETTVKYTTSDGKEIDAAGFDKANQTPTTYTVPKGHTITQIATDMLKQQGIENPTKEQIQEAKQQVLEANADQVHTMKSGQYKGNKYFYADATLKVPTFNTTSDKVTEKSVEEPTYDGGVLPEVVVTAKRPDQATIAKRRELQAQLGDKFDVGYAQDGTIEVRDKDGNILPEATKKANQSLSTSTTESPQVKDGNTTHTELTEETIKTGDKDNSQTLDKGEYQNFIIQTLGLEITDANREKIQNLIDSSFQSLDSVAVDGQVTKDELDKSAAKVFEQLGNDVNAMEQAEFDATQMM